MLTLLSIGLVALVVSSYGVTANLCAGKCRFYQVCNDVGECVCPPQCDRDSVALLCTNRNQTFENECEFHRYVCKVLRTRPKARIPHIDYKGACQSEHPCTTDKFEQFPSRLTEWMEIIHNRELSLTGEFERVVIADECERWNFAKESLESKFMELDDDADGLLNTSEIHELRKSLTEVEACTRRFFHNCGNKTGRVTLDQWKRCLKLPLEPQCATAPAATPTESKDTVVDVETDSDTDKSVGGIKEVEDALLKLLDENE